MFRLVFPTLAIAASLACTPSFVDVPLDMDEDGLLSDAEAELGTDPENPDSDGDGHVDGDEVSVGTDPLDGSSHPYKGGWAVDADCRDEIASTGDNVGQITADFTLPDRFGEDVRAYDFCARAILLTVGAFW